MRRCRPASEAGYTIVELMAAVAITLFVMAGVYGLMVQNQHIYEQQSRIADTQQAARVALDLITREIRMAGGDPTTQAFITRAACENGAYKWPTDPKAPAPDDVAPITVATSAKIRVKMDRPTWTLPPEPPVYVGNPHNDRNGDGDYNEDDENVLGDSFVNDEGEDVTFEWVAAEKRLYRIETRTLIPAIACRAASSTPAAGAVTRTPLADHIQDFQLKYYDTSPPKEPCPPSTRYADAAAYEAAKDICDPPLTTLDDLSSLRRVRVRITVETDRPDSQLPKLAPKFGRQWITLASEAAVRNR